MASKWKFGQVPEIFRRREKKNSNPSVNQKRIYNITEPFFTDIRGRKFQRWASQNELSINTQEILAQDHFDSMSTIKSLTPEMVFDLHLTGEEQTKLLDAIDRLHHSEPEHSIKRIADLHRIASLPFILSKSFSTPPVLKEESPMESPANDSDDVLDGTVRLRHNEPDESFIRKAEWQRVTSLPVILSKPLSDLPELTKETWRERPSSGPNEELFEMTPISDKEEAESEGRKLIVDIKKLNMAEVKAVLELMVSVKIINSKIHRDVLEATCEDQLKERVNILLNLADKVARREVQRRFLAQRQLEHSTRSEEGLESYRTARSPLDKKRVSFESFGADSDRPNSPSFSERCSGNSSPPAADKPFWSDVGITNSVFQADAEIFTISHDECGGQINPLFDDYDGRGELPKAVLQTFGQKGRGCGKLEDASSITCTEQGEVILTDFINNKVQIFESNGKASRELTVANMRGPWNVVMSPHEWIVVTCRGSKRVCLIGKDGEEVFFLEHDIFECPAGLAVDHVGRYIITDCGTNQVYRLTCDNGPNKTSLECLNSKLNFNQPRYVTVSPTGQIIVSDSGNNCVKILSQNGELECEFGQYGRRHGNFRSPYAVCCDHHGNIIVADHYNNRVSMFSPNGLFIRHLLSDGHGLARPQGLHITRDRKLYVTHGRMKANQVLVFDLCEGAEAGLGV